MCMTVLNFGAIRHRVYSCVAQLADAICLDHAETLSTSISKNQCVQFWIGRHGQRRTQQAQLLVSVQCSALTNTVVLLQKAENVTRVEADTVHYQLICEEKVELPL